MSVLASFTTALVSSLSVSSSLIALTKFVLLVVVKLFKVPILVVLALTLVERVPTVVSRLFISVVFVEILVVLVETASSRASISSVLLLILVSLLAILITAAAMSVVLISRADLTPPLVTRLVLLTVGVKSIKLFF